MAQFKVLILGTGLVMISQNFCFFLAYWDLWSQISQDADCSGTSFWFGFDAFICFFDTVMVAGMMLGAWIDGSKLLWWVFFVVHLIGGLTYTVAVIGLGAARYSDDGKACAERHMIGLTPGVGERGTAVFITQAAFYLFYCVGMASFFYQVVLKGNKERKKKDDDDKYTISGIGLLMVSQNLSFFLAFWDLWSQVSRHAICSGTSFWLGFDSFICFFETVMVCGMVLGAWVENSKSAFWFFFVVHLLGGLTYTVATIGLGVARYGADGKACAEIDHGFGTRSAATWNTQASFYLVYCGCMAGLFFQVAFNSKKEKGDEASGLVLRAEA